MANAPLMAASDLKSLQNFLWRNWILGQPSFCLLVVYASSFWFTLTQSVRPPMVTFHLLRGTCVTYEMSCRAIGYQVLLTQPLPREVEDFPRGGNILSICLCSHA